MNICKRMTCSSKLSLCFCVNPRLICENFISFYFLFSVFTFTQMRVVKKSSIMLVTLQDLCMRHRSYLWSDALPVTINKFSNSIKNHMCQSYNIQWCVYKTIKTPKVQNFAEFALYSLVVFIAEQDLTSIFGFG